MIDFQSIQFKIDKYYSFVGIKKDYKAICFYLPKGFEEFVRKDSTFIEKKNLFFQCYKITSTFKEICAVKGYLEDNSKIRTKDRDGVIKSNSGSGIQDNREETENIFYSKLDIIGSLLNAYDEPKILSLAYRLGVTDKFDVSKIHRYLHQATYLPNNAAYVDQMILPKKVVQFESTDIVAMYCYLFCEVKQQLQESVTPEIASLAESFRQHYLGSQDSIFDEQTYEQTLNTLKDALETIDHNTPIKDADYWQYYEAIELFLYGDFSKSEDGEIWGISNFHSVWESMCLTFLAKTIKSPSLLLQIDTRYLDPQLCLTIKTPTKTNNLSNIFKLNNTNLSPDLVFRTVLLNKIDRDFRYIIERDNWDDFGYKTTLKLTDDSLGANSLFNDEEFCFKSVCINLTEKHVFDLLGTIYEKKSSTQIVVDRTLPPACLSFWLIDENLSLACIQKMDCFNHMFFVALRRKILDWNEFVTKILSPLGVAVDESWGQFLGNNVFDYSFFRCLSLENVKSNFENFIRQAKQMGIANYTFKVIDVKYFAEEYFLNTNNIEEIKIRSVRKQFVYEHLLQKRLMQEYGKNSKFTINSSFWLPSYRPDDPNLIEDGSTFMDGYIKLKNVNFKILADNYVT